MIKESKDFIKAIKKRDERLKRLNNKEFKKLNNKEVKKRPIEPLEKVIKESKDLIKEIKKRDEKKNKLLDYKEKARKEYIKNTDEILKNARESIMKEHKKC